MEYNVCNNTYIDDLAIMFYSRTALVIIARVINISFVHFVISEGIEQ